MNVSPSRFSDMTDKEAKLFSIDWRNALDTGQTISSPQWESEPTGMNFENADISGTKATVLMKPGARGQTYRIRHRVTVDQTSEVLELTHNGQPGIELQIVGHGKSGDDYRWSHRFHAYGG